MTSVADPQTFQFKLVLLGDSAVGKSSLVLRLVKGQFFDYQESTIGAAFLVQQIPLTEHNCIIRLEIWDTAGQERYHSLAPMYYRGAAAALIVYDISNQNSFVRAKSWVKELQRQGTPNMVMCLVGNKTDLETERQVDAQEGKSFADENGLLFFETSAKLNKGLLLFKQCFFASHSLLKLGVTDAFYAVAQKLPFKHLTTNSRSANQVDLSKPAATPASTEESGKCCS